MISIDEGAIYYVDWKQPPPGTSDHWMHPNDDKGVTIRKNCYSDELAEMRKVSWLRPESSPRFVHTFGHPAIGHQFKLDVLTLPLLVVGVMILKRPRPYPPGQCSECGYDLS